MATYQHFYVPPGAVQDPDIPFNPASLRVGLEIQLNGANINMAERLDMADGSRIYRVPDGSEARKLPTDNLGYFLYNSENPDGPVIRPTTTDPSFDLPILRDYVNIRS